MSIEKKVFLGVHVPKCAGSSILSELKRVYGDQCYQSTSLVNNFRGSKSDLTDTYKNLDYSGYFGHHFCDELLKIIGRDVFLFTFLRDPLERAVSHYKYVNRMKQSLGRQPVAFSDFIKTLPSMTKFLLQRFPSLVDQSCRTEQAWLKAASILKKFDFVGDTEGIESFQEVFAREFGVNLNLKVVKNKAPKDGHNLDCHQIEAMLGALEDDVLLYQWYKRCWHLSRDEVQNSELDFYVNSEFNKDRFFNFHASSLIQDLKANNALDLLRDFPFKDDEFRLVIWDKLNRSQS
ncbi:sulfotransferase family 2 domain-containing protein [Marinobacter xiaoshiensis]|uniref:Sulfotransferase family 2 domain-containing protein n=1 Tax=Marinobacter xiaoshiensis TaxID=3073652 RepID=A0ABU2HFU8_9GAMM|nr:sulfotransferase family 2 domain-containing protein [Marinobacter sp. F60267]MDS1309461.1 sulfotransferase family 2 domain-containing protein [Marinobacter sp. F60267]